MIILLISVDLVKLYMNKDRNRPRFSKVTAESIFWRRWVGQILHD